MRECGSSTSGSVEAPRGRSARDVGPTSSARCARSSEEVKGAPSAQYQLEWNWFQNSMLFRVVPSACCVGSDPPAGRTCRTCAGADTGAGAAGAEGSSGRAGIADGVGALASQAPTFGAGTSAAPMRTPCHAGRSAVARLRSKWRRLLLAASPPAAATPARALAPGEVCAPSHRARTRTARLLRRRRAGHSAAARLRAK